MAKRPPAKKKSSMLATDFGKRLRALREERGLTQRHVAERIGVHVPQISRYEAGGSMPNAETLIELSGVLEVGLDELVLGRDGKRTEETIRDVRLLERVRELEKLDRRFRETAIAVIDAIVVQGNQDAVSTRLSKRR
jgi:transcriptional regulator with XRE-family HTH domain